MVVVLFGFFVLGFSAYRTYSGGSSDFPQRVRTGGRVLYTGADILAGQQVFLRNGLMEYGSIFSVTAPIWVRFHGRLFTPRGDQRSQFVR